MLILTVEPADAVWQLAVLEEESRQDRKPVPQKRLSFGIQPAGGRIVRQAAERLELGLVRGDEHRVVEHVLEPGLELLQALLGLT